MIGIASQLISSPMEYVLRLAQLFQNAAIFQR
jgi:hypothetical protein